MSNCMPCSLSSQAYFESSVQLSVYGKLTLYFDLVFLRLNFRLYTHTYNSLILAVHFLIYQSLRSSLLYVPGKKVKLKCAR